MTQSRIKSIHFPAIQYFALFNRKCIVGKQDCSTLCAPDLSLIRTALPGERSYNLGAIVARRVQHNANSGYFYGGIYASRLARGLGVSPFSFDPILPMQYLDFDALKSHKILKEKFHNFTYNLAAIVARRLQHNANSGYFYVEFMPHAWHEGWVFHLCPLTLSYPHSIKTLMF